MLCIFEKGTHPCILPMGASYKHQKWLMFREELLELDGRKCTQCARTQSSGAVLQVHHKYYLTGRLPWEYPYSDCEVLCKGCHGELHGRVMPKTGWDLLYEDDLEGLDGNCGFCNTEIRYVFHIHHPTWEPMEVGTNCCDRLTQTYTASEITGNRKRYDARLRRFVSSTRWENIAGRECIKQNGLVFRICSNIIGYRVSVALDWNSLEKNGTQYFKTPEAAKTAIFRSADNGKAVAYLRSPTKHADA